MSLATVLEMAAGGCGKRGAVIAANEELSYAEYAEQAATLA